MVNTQYTVPVGVIGAIPLDDQFPEPNLLVRRFDGGDDRIFGYDAALCGQWRHVPDIATFQSLGFYWCNVTAADAGFFERLTPGPPYPASAIPPRGDYPNCLTVSRESRFRFSRPTGEPNDEAMVRRVISPR